MTPRAAPLIASAVLVSGLLTGCSDDSTPVMDPGDGGRYRPDLEAAQVADVIDNPYLPFTVGSRWRYEGESDGEHEVIEVVVTADRRPVMGIYAFVVRDTVTIDGELVEETLDWYAQDRAGNVWYLGEDSKELEHGVVVSTAGSWEAGVDGALPGIVMPAAPQVGEVYRQEYYAGEAEDMMQITATGGSLTIAGTDHSDVVTTQDWTPLEPDVIEEKAYAPGVGLVRERTVAGGSGYAELVDHTPGS